MNEERIDLEVARGQRLALLRLREQEGWKVLMQALHANAKSGEQQILTMDPATLDDFLREAGLRGERRGIRLMVAQTEGGELMYPFLDTLIEGLNLVIEEGIAQEESEDGN